MRELRVLLLGRPRLELDGQSLAGQLAAKQQALLYHLAVEGGPVPRSRLAALLWEELDEAAARGNLRGALMRLRRALPDVLEADAQQVGFGAALAVTVDRSALADALDERRPHELRVAAARAWRGPLLDGFDLPGADGFERWLAQARQRALRDAVQLRRSLARRAEAEGHTDEVIDHWRGLLDIDDADEPAHMALMQALAARGQRTAAIAQYEACRAALADRLGARPSAACYALYTRIHADAPAGPVAAPAPAGGDMAVRPAGSSPDVAATPRPATAPGDAAAEASGAGPGQPPPADGPLIGRDAELALIAERLADPECRWLTLVGPGGVGKTRLALAAATASAPHCRHGVLWFSGRDEGGALRDAETLSQHVVERTGADRHRPGALLLVLDNLETVPGAAMLAPLLRARAPGVRVLATSRRRLGASREWLLELHGLSLARDASNRPASSPAAQLLAQALRRVDPRFDLAAEADAGERLCERVGGLPLALELAARGVLVAGLGGVLARLESGAALEDPAREVDGARHHSIALVMSDAWALLPATAQSAAQRLAWLPGAFDLALAETAGVQGVDVERLREHSWLRRTDEGMLALHPLQQDFLRRQAGAAVLQAQVRRALAERSAVALPAVPPFGRWPQAQSAGVLAASPLFSASVLAEALEHQAENAPPHVFAAWVDGVVALLWADDRLAEAAALLERAGRRADLPDWRHAGWAMQRAEALNTLGDAIASTADHERALARLGLDAATREGSRWRDLPRVVPALWRLAAWPAGVAEREAFNGLVGRSLMMYTQQLSFTPSMDRSVRANLLATGLAYRASRTPDRYAMRVMSAYGMTVSGWAAPARWLLRSTERRRPVADDPVLEAFTREGECATRIALGQWQGVADELFELCETMQRLGDHRHAMECHSLVAKLFFYQGQLERAAERFAESSELSLRRPGGAWRAWGPFGQAEVALCLGRASTDQLRRWMETGSHWMTETINMDAAYTLRRFGLMARLAWRDGDVARAREVALGGAAAALRIAHCGFWAQEGLAGIGEVLLRLRVHDQRVGGALGPLDEAWRRFERRLDAHGRSFPAGRAMVHRLRGEMAHAQGRGADARRWLDRAVSTADGQGLQVELARSCEALGRIEPASNWGERARRLWLDMGAVAPA